MASLPTVAIIGRPNTGKSTLFNRLVGRRRAIVSDIPGTTRDHVAGRIATPEMDFLLVDTGGMGGGTEDEHFEDDVHAQSVLALENADVIVVTLNSREELTASDMGVVDTLRKRKQQHVPVIIVLTKCDNPVEAEEMLPHFHQLGIADDFVITSAAHNIGIDELRDVIIEKLQSLHFKKEETEESEAVKIALVGKPNVGKSSIINAFMSEPQRKKSPLLVSEVPGTTRDSVDVAIKYHDRDYLFIDTAGIKRRRSTDKGIETFAYFRSIQSLSEADIAVLVLDATQQISKQDKRIAGLAVEEGKGLIILLNKIDLVDADLKAAQINEVRLELPFCKFAPIIPVSAENREGLLKIFEQIEVVQQSRTRRLQTKALNDWFRDTVYGQPLGQLTRTKHITQADEIPPTFVVFVSDPKKVQVSQLRHLENSLRRTFGFDGTPVRWITKIG